MAPSTEKKEDELVISNTSVAALVESLNGSSLMDGGGGEAEGGGSNPRVDYCAFIRAFVVRDLEGEII